MEFMGIDIVDGGYYYVETRCGARSIFVHSDRFTAVTSYRYRIHFVGYYGVPAYRLATSSLICINSSVTKIRPCNENERAMLDWYIQKG